MRRKCTNGKLTGSDRRIFSLCLIDSPCNDGDDYYARLQPNIVEASEGYVFNFSCSTNLQTIYPRWEINDQEYDVIDLPPEYTVSGPNLGVNVERNVKIRCFVKTFSNRSTKGIYSNEATVMRANQGANLRG